MNLKLPLCVDISHWHLVPDFKMIFPVPFLVITKATEGINYIDQTFVRYMIGIKEAGYVRGAYHFNRKIYGGADQARHFISVCNGYVDDETLLILDVEEGREEASQLWSWMETVLAKYPHNRLLIYSRKNILETITMTTAEKEYFKRIPVWVAGYPADPDKFNCVPGAYVPDQTRWGPVVLWQYSEVGQVAGISGDCDVNWIDPVFEKILRGATIPQEEAMSQWYMVNTTALNIRSGPGASYVDIGDLLKGEKIESPAAAVGGWYKITNVYHLDGTLQNVTGDAWCSGAYLVPTNAPIIAPPPPPVTVKTPFTLAVQGYKPYSGELEKA